MHENELIVHPLVTLMERRYGWFCVKIHGSQYQSGLPDLYCMHKSYEPKWVECKVVRQGDFSFTDDQLRVFPKMIANNAKIWIVYGADFRKDLDALGRMYNKLFQAPNAPYLLDPASRRSLIR